MSERSIRLALACYPPSFRERYGEEMTALVSDRGTSAHTVSNLLAGAARAWARPVLAGGPEERGRRRLQATVTTVWVTVIAGFLVAPATDRALLDPAPAYIPTGTVVLFTIGAGAAALACLLAASPCLLLFLHTIRAHHGEQRRRSTAPARTWCCTCCRRSAGPRLDHVVARDIPAAQRQSALSRHIHRCFAPLGSALRFDTDRSGVRARDRSDSRHPPGRLASTGCPPCSSDRRAGRHSSNYLDDRLSDARISQQL